MFAYVPFIDPINLFHTWWWTLIVPLALGISITYKALRIATFDRYWREVTFMTTQIVLGLAALGVALNLFVLYVIPLIPVTG